MLSWEYPTPEFSTCDNKISNQSWRRHLLLSFG
jgi:hypothetical protein